ncbi:MAG: cupin domain-containing protein [Chloroflexi bacterium]|nr:cupin domain-containing protein [Chloroflexota bacterium]
MLSQSASKATPEELASFYRDLETQSTAALWTVQESVLVNEPKSKAVPHVWRWKELRPQAMRAADLIGTQDAERRVIMLLNPGLDGRIATTNSLFSGLQIVMPGESARAHRHTPAALRFIIESDGGYTTVNGDRIPMHNGDLVLTPNWTWHDHGNNTNTPIMWLDGLDLPLAHMLEAVFYEPYSEDVQPVTLPTDSSLTTYGAASLRPTWENPTETHSPLMHYPWDQTWAALQRLAPVADGSPYDGVVLEYTNPNTGGPVMPTMACHIQLLRPGESTKAHRHTSSTIYHVVEGEGFSVVDGQRLDWENKDVFCVPGWAFHEHANASATEPAVLFSFTDAPVLRSLSLLREQPHPEGHQ